MDEWRFVSDSSCDLLPENWDEPDVPLSIVPLTITVDGDVFVDEPGADVDLLLKRMETSRRSSSACPSVDAYAAEFRKAKNVFCIAMTSQLGGSYNAAVQARRLVLEEDPFRRIAVVDSHAVSGSHLLLLRELLRMVREKIPFETMEEAINRFRDEIHTVFTVATFRTLVQNGRLSRTKGALASALRIRPICANSPIGELVILEKPRGIENAVARMCEIVGELKDITGKGIILNYVDDIRPAEMLRDLLKKAYPQVGYIEMMRTRLLIAHYACSGGVLMSF